MEVVWSRATESSRNLQHNTDLSNNTILTPTHDPGFCRALNQHIAYPPPKYGSHITHLVLQLDTPMQRMSLTTLLHSELLYLFAQPKQSADFIPRNVTLRMRKPTYLSHFPKLESLDVNVGFLSDTNPVPYDVGWYEAPGWESRNAWEYECFEDKVEEMVLVLEQCELVVLVKEFKVKVYCEGCRKNGLLGQQEVTNGRTLVGMQEPECGCEGMLEGGLEKLLQKEETEVP